MELFVECGGYFREPFRSAEQIARVMADIESFVIERPEFEVSDEDMTFGVHIGALYAEESSSLLPVGWLVSRIDHETEKFAFCDASASIEPVLGLMFCGAPVTVSRSAILNKEQVFEVLRALLDGDLRQKQFCLRSFEEVLEG